MSSGDLDAQPLNELRSELTKCETTTVQRDFRFWFIIAAVMAGDFIVVLEAFAMSTPLPTIVSDLHGTQFLWIPTAYTLASVALIPLSGGLAEIYGRRLIMLASLFLFMTGSVIGGAAQNMNMLIAARAVQGAGAGAIVAVGQIVLSDLVPLRERGMYIGAMGIITVVSTGAGPIVGGGLAKHKVWRWLFFLNIPVAGVVFLITLIFMKLPVPPGTVHEKAIKIDWIGNIIVIGSTCACTIAFAWGGVVFSWGSAQILAPLIIGLVGIMAFVMYETLWCAYPIVPFKIISNRTSLSGYLQLFLCTLEITVLLYYVPIYYQACKDASPIVSGLDAFGAVLTLAPCGIIAGISVNVTKRYRPQIWVGWVFTTIGLGLLTTVHDDTSRASSIGFQAIAGFGIGLVYSTAVFPVMAPLPVSLTAHALAFSTFFRNLSQVWGITIGGTILQNQLSQKLPSTFAAHFNGSASIAYSIVPQIRSLPQPLKDGVRTAFADSLATVWTVLTAISGFGLLVSLPMKGLPLHAETDERWALGESLEERGLNYSDVTSEGIDTEVKSS